MTSQTVVDEHEVARRTKDTVLYFLTEHCKNATIKRPDLIKAILSNVNRRTQNEVLKRTKEILKKVYGLAIIELDENVKHYMLVNEVEYNPDAPLNWDEEKKLEQKLLLPILTVIFMNGGTIPEGELWLFLKRLRIIDGSSHINEEFGDLDKLLKKDFIHQRYLVYEQVKLGNPTDLDDNVFEFKWGRRAEAEVKKEQILRHVSEIFGCEITEFAEQCAQITI